jgi:hypothetical protein
MKQVQALLAEGLDHEEIGHRLGIPAGQVYLIGTGTPADGGHSADGTGPRPGALASSQHLSNPPHDNPTSKRIVHEWIAGRVAADEQQRFAAARRKARQQSEQEENR